MILSAVRARVRKTTHKYWIAVPTSVEHAKQLDEQNGNTFWMDAMEKEMTSVGVAFEVLADGQKAPVGWDHATGHVVRDKKWTLPENADGF